MAKRRTRPRTPPRKARGVLSWLVVLALGGVVGWLWWRAAYGPGASDVPPQGLGEGWRGPADEEFMDSVPFPNQEGSRGLEDDSRRRRPARAAVPPPSFPTELLVFPTNPVVHPAPDATGTTIRVEEPPPGLKEGENVLAVQLALARRGISSGPIDGVVGSQTRAALRIFQRAEGLPATGSIDSRTVARLGLGQPTLTNYTVTVEDLSRLTTVPSTWLGKSSRERLDYETMLELVSEKSHAHPRLIRELNPGINWHRVRVGTTVKVPASALPPLRGRAGFVRISLSEKALRVFDPSSNLVAHFPCSIARKVEKRPVGELRVVRLAPNPNYRFDPQIFKDSAEARRIGRKLMIPPGPNNPVGTAWIGLSRAGYGIHGTPHPEDVGRTESHGCFRLANWNAEFLIRAAWVGMPVFVEP